MSQSYALPISLSDVFNAIGLDGIEQIAELVNATRLEPKANERLRFVCEGAFLIAYRTTANILGRDELTMKWFAAGLRNAAGTRYPEYYCNPEASHFHRVYDLARYAIELHQKSRQIFHPNRCVDYMLEFENFLTNSCELESEIVDVLREYNDHAAIWYSCITLAYNVNNGNSYEEGYRDGYGDGRMHDAIENVVEEDDIGGHAPAIERNIITPMHYCAMEEFIAAMPPEAQAAVKQETQRLAQGSPSRRKRRRSKK